ncbi:MAG: mycofactocin biosynthesis chaperone MftB [Acidimicrobiales bacterium]
MGCVASTNPASEPNPASDLPPPAGPTRFDSTRPYRLDPQVALRPEPFGALAYHYGNRRLTFVRAAELVDVLRDLDRHDTVEATLAASPVPPARWPAFRTALAALADSEVIVAR